MIDVLWNIVSYTGLIAFLLAIIGTCIFFGLWHNQYY